MLWQKNLAATSNLLKMKLFILNNKPCLENDNLFVYFLSFLIFMVGLYFSPYYHSGDQISYTNYYNSVVGQNLLKAYFLQIQALSSYEPLYAFFVWVFSPFIEKDIFDSLLNFFLCYSATHMFLRLGASKLLIIFFVLANFYFLVLYFAADRLKLSFIFLFFGLNALCNKKEKRSALWLLFAVFSHLQVLLFLFSFTSVLLAKSSVKIAARYVINIKELFLIVFFAVFVLLMSIFFHDHISNKLGFYLSNNITEIFKPAVFMVLSLFSTANNYYVIASFIPLLIAAFVVSGDRVVMMAYFLFVFYSIGERGISHKLIWLTSLYFTYKSYFFIQNIVLFGNGFV